MRLTPKNWAEFQHYKDRAPAWIKLHKNLLDNFEYQCLPLASRALAPMLWLLASEYEDGVIDASAEKIAFRLRVSPKELMDAIKPLIDNNFFTFEQDASNVLADCLPRVREREEKEKEREKSASDDAPPHGLDLKAWERWLDYRKQLKKPIKPASFKSAQKLLADFGKDQSAVVEQSVANGWQGLFALKTTLGGTNGIALGGSATQDPESRAAIEADGERMGIGRWDETKEQWHSYKQRVRGRSVPAVAPNIAALVADGLRRH